MVRLLAALALLLVLAACGGGSDDDGAAAGQASLDEVQQIVERRCVQCHSDKPTIEGYEQAGLPNFEVAANIEANKDAIYQVVVVQKRMPFNSNVTKMTQEERDRVASWAKPD
jgi:uncharacterized membrane protein